MISPSKMDSNTLRYGLIDRQESDRYKYLGCNQTLPVREKMHNQHDVPNSVMNNVTLFNTKDILGGHSLSRSNAKFKMKTAVNGEKENYYDRYCFKSHFFPKRCILI